MSENIHSRKLSVIYKYRPLFNDQGIQYTDISQLNVNTLNILCNRELYFSAPEKFNDPFDSKITYNNKAKPKEIGIYLKSTFNLKDDEISKIILDIERKSIDLSDFAPEDDPNYKSPLRVCCFSSESNNILLWSHYALNHTGVCIGFKVYHKYKSVGINIHKGCIGPIISSIGDEFAPLIPVKYKKHCPKPYNIVKGNSNDLKLFLLRKSIDWKYEKEYRIPVGFSQLHKNPITLPEQELIEVIFGMRTEDKIISDVIDFCNKPPNSAKYIKFKRCVPVKGKYKIIVVDI